MNSFQLRAQYGIQPASSDISSLGTVNAMFAWAAVIPIATSVIGAVAPLVTSAISSSVQKQKDARQRNAEKRERLAEEREERRRMREDN